MEYFRSIQRSSEPYPYNDNGSERQGFRVCNRAYPDNGQLRSGLVSDDDYKYIDELLEDEGFVEPGE